MMAVNNFGRADLYRGAYSTALASFEEALALARASGNREVEIEELNNIGTVHYLRGAIPRRPGSVPGCAEGRRSG